MAHSHALTWPGEELGDWVPWLSSVDKSSCGEFFFFDSEGERATVSKQMSRLRQLLLCRPGAGSCAWKRSLELNETDTSSRNAIGSLIDAGFSLLPEVTVHWWGWMPTKICCYLLVPATRAWSWREKVVQRLGNKTHRWYRNKSPQRGG